jgi:hypothetical protein
MHGVLSGQIVNMSQNVCAKSHCTSEGAFCILGGVKPNPHPEVVQLGRAKKRRVRRDMESRRRSRGARDRRASTGEAGDASRRKVMCGSCVAPRSGATLRTQDNRGTNTCRVICGAVPDRKTLLLCDNDKESYIRLWRKHVFPRALAGSARFHLIDL